MADETLTFTHKGREVTIVEEGDSLQLTIDGEPIEVERDAMTGECRAPQELFTTYSSLPDLAKGIIDSRDKFGI